MAAVTSAASVAATMGPLGAFQAVRCVHAERKIEELGFRLPSPSKPAANYILVNRVGNLVFTGA
jgi:hypothetical protein